MANIVKNQYIKMDNFYIIRITSNKHGVFDIKIDEDMIDICKEHHWSINRFKRGKAESHNKYFYAINPRIGLLHRYLIDAQKGKVVDHINGDTLDNRKSNLQICSYRENLSKQKKRNTNKSGHTGVIWNNHIPTPKWMAYICHKNKRITLGYFDKKEDAIVARRNAELEYFGEFIPIGREVG